MNLTPELLSELIIQGTTLAFRIAQVKAQGNGRSEPTAEDFEAARLELDRVLGSGRTVGELRERLKEIAGK